jgi:predicted permease
LIESLLLASVAGVVSLLVAWLGIGTLTKALPPALAGVAPARLDGRTIAFTVAVALGTGTLFGLWPAFGASRTAPADSIKAASSGATRRQRGTAQPVLVVVEVALATMLLIGSGLTLQSLRALLATDAGFRTDRLATAQLTLPNARYARQPARAQFANDVVTRLRAMPGVRSAALTHALPLAPEGGLGLSVRPEGAPTDYEAVFPRYLMATPGYFETMGIALLRGTDLPAVVDSTRNVAVINRALADTLWPGQDALGKRFVMGRDARTVIGVIQNVRLDSLNLAPQPQMYFPIGEQAPNYMAIVARSTSDGGALVTRLREAVRAVDARQPVYNARMMRDVVAASVSPQRTNATLLTIFGAVALLVASVGVYALLAFAIAQRTRELAVRLALGARERDLVTLVLRNGLLLAVGGALLGAGAAYALARFIRSLLYEVSPHDPRVFVAAPLVLIAVAALATWIPARRGARVSPMLVMRGE